MIKIILEMLLTRKNFVSPKVLYKCSKDLWSNYKTSRNWEKLFINLSNVIAEDGEMSEDLINKLKKDFTKKNLRRLSKEMKNVSGYDFKAKLSEKLVKLMTNSEIPSEVAEEYSKVKICELIEGLKTIDSEKYREIHDVEIHNEIKTMHLENKKRYDLFNNEHVFSAGQIDLRLKQNTSNPSIGLEYFKVDDFKFKEDFKEKINEDVIIVKGFNRKETAYCVINELLFLEEVHPIYVVENSDSWKRLIKSKVEGNIFIPLFHEEKIEAIPNNTTIFILSEHTPVFNKEFMELRPRTISTLSECLRNAGADFKRANYLLNDTHGLFSQIEKHIFTGIDDSQPSWKKKVSQRAISTCLLFGAWEEVEGDKLIVESLYDNNYDSFLEEINPYINNEDSLICKTKEYGRVFYYLPSVENIWSYYGINNNDEFLELFIENNKQIWKLFLDNFDLVLTEPEKLLTCDAYEMMNAQIRGEKLFWSETIRRGMLQTLMEMAKLCTNYKSQKIFDEIISNVLQKIQNEDDWKYISNFWTDLCEISPEVTLSRLEKEVDDSNSVLFTIKDQSQGSVFEKSSYVSIINGFEQFLCQKKYFWRAYRCLLKIDSFNFSYSTNSPKDTIKKVLCTWINSSVLKNAKDKIKAAKIALEISPINAWEYIYLSADPRENNYFIDLIHPKYRGYENSSNAINDEMIKTNKGYLKILMDNIDNSSDRWNKLIDLSVEMNKELKEEVFEKLLNNLNKINEDDKLLIKNNIRRTINMHRYFKNSEWAMSDEDLELYNSLLNKIHLEHVEYEYNYLFLNDIWYPQNSIIPFREEEDGKINDARKDEFIRTKLEEFQCHNYDLKKLASSFSVDSDNTLGYYLSQYWNYCKWDYFTFKELLSVHGKENENIALAYMAGIACKENLSYIAIIDDLKSFGFSKEIITAIYRIEAENTKNIPLIDKESDSVKILFWKYRINLDENNTQWAIKECKKYGSLNSFLVQLYMLYYNKKIYVEQIYENLLSINKSPYYLESISTSSMVKYYVQQLVKAIQEKYLSDSEKIIEIAKIELYFSSLLEWDEMKCLQIIFKQSPKLFADIIKVIYKKDNETNVDITNNEDFNRSMYRLYRKAHFCPAEKDGKVDEVELEKWILEFRQLLITNNQDSLFTLALGRLFSFSPVGTDGHEPCESVRNMIEKYGDDEMNNSYITEVCNRRGVYNLTAGEDEFKIANALKENGEYLESEYSETAKMYFDLYNIYMHDSERERRAAENLVL